MLFLKREQCQGNMRKYFLSQFCFCSQALLLSFRGLLPLRFPCVLFFSAPYQNASSTNKTNLSYFILIHHNNSICTPKRPLYSKLTYSWPQFLQYRIPRQQLKAVACERAFPLISTFHVSCCEWHRIMVG